MGSIQGGITIQRSRKCAKSQNEYFNKAIEEICGNPRDAAVLQG